MNKEDICIDNNEIDEFYLQPSATKHGYNNCFALRQDDDLIIIHYDTLNKLIEELQQLI